ncbi:MAG: helix-turn-helix transcriptional regulator [Candidatus Omnitrophota bacterium]
MKRVLYVEGTSPPSGAQCPIFRREAKNWGRWWLGKGKRFIIVRWISLPNTTATYTITATPPPKNCSLGNKIRFARQSLGKTQKTLSEMIKHPRSLISRYEQDKIRKPNTKVLLDIAKSLKVSPDKLISIQQFQPIGNKAEIDKLYAFLKTPHNFGKKLRDLRLRANIEQKALALEVGINRESIRRYERNITRPSKAILAKIIEALKDSSRKLQEKYYHNKGADSSKFVAKIERRN